jgi:hypothetical protein
MRSLAAVNRSPAAAKNLAVVNRSPAVAENLAAVNRSPAVAENLAAVNRSPAAKVLAAVNLGTEDECQRPERRHRPSRHHQALLQVPPP